MKLGKYLLKMRSCYCCCCCERSLRHISRLLPSSGEAIHSGCRLIGWSRGGGPCHELVGRKGLALGVCVWLEVLQAHSF